MLDILLSNLFKILLIFNILLNTLFNFNSLVILIFFLKLPVSLFKQHVIVFNQFEPKISNHALIRFFRVFVKNIIQLQPIFHLVHYLVFECIAFFLLHDFFYVQSCKFFYVFNLIRIIWILSVIGTQNFKICCQLLHLYLFLI